MVSPRPRLAVVLLAAALASAGISNAAPFPRAGFTFTPPNPSVTSTVHFTDTSSGAPTSWLWNFGDPASDGNDTSTDQNPTHVFNSAGDYSVSLTVTNDSGSSTISQTLTILPPQVPNASFTFVADKLRVQFTDTSTNNPTAWSWNFGDGASSNNTSTLQNPIHTYSTEGKYTVKLVATNIAGDSQPAFRSLTVFRTVQVPVATFAFSVSRFTAGFTDTSANSPTAWSWDFGDPDSGGDNVSDLQNPTHTFTRVGAYTVMLVASNAAGASAPASRVVVIGTTPAPVASFAFTVDGLTVAFTDTSTNGPTSWSWNFGDDGSPTNTSTARNPTHVYPAFGTYTVTLVASNAVGSSAPATMEVVLGNCVADATTLCLNSGRFRVGVVWSVPAQNRSGVGMAVPLTGDTGYFWFFTSANVELVVKVLDARGVNSAFWVFYGALSDVEYTVTVTDTLTGDVKAYPNASGHLASVGDTSAFPQSVSVQGVQPEARVSPESLAERSTEELYALYASLTATATARAARPPDSVDACTATAEALCLNQSRFRVTVNWQVPSQNRFGSGQAVPISGDTGYFWFFSSANVELTLKVLDGRSVNGHFWVFYGALSNVQYTITVTDTQTSAFKVYPNPSGTLASVADTSAF